MSLSKAEDPRSPLACILARETLHQVLLRLGLTFSECQGIVEYDPEAETAYWRFNRKTGEEQICLGPKITQLPVSSVEMVLRHELLHRSVYHGFGEIYSSSEIANIALDICINRLLFDAWPEAMRALSEKVYPEESHATLICLCNCAAPFSEIGKRWRPMWREIWGQENEQAAPLNPASLYFRLLRHTPELRRTMHLNPFPSHMPSSEESSEQRIPERMRRAYQKAAEGLNRAQQRKSSLGRSLEAYSVEPARLGDSTLENFLLRLPVRKQMSELASRITRPARPSYITQPYPVRLTRKGLVWQALGVSQALHQYHNQEPAEEKHRMVLSIYMDVSGSMVDLYPIVAYCVETLREYPLKVYTFDTEVREQSVDDLRQGRIEGGGGTDFNALGRHILGNREIRSIVVFTDGYGELEFSLASTLMKERCRIYVVYLQTDGTGMSMGNGLSSVALETLTIACKPELIRHLAIVPHEIEVEK